MTRRCPKPKHRLPAPDWVAVASICCVGAILLTPSLRGQANTSSTEPPTAPTAPVAATSIPSGPFGLAWGSEVEPGLLASGQPTADQLRALADAGFAAILDLRTPAEERGFDEPDLLRELGLDYISLPVSTSSLDRATIDRFRELLRSAPRPLLMHCGSAVRVGGLLYAAWLLDEGADPAETLERAEAAGLRSPELTAKVQELLGITGTSAPPPVVN